MTSTHRVNLRRQDNLDSFRPFLCQKCPKTHLRTSLPTFFWGVILPDPH